MSSFGTVRKKKPCRLTPSVWPSVSETRVADPETQPEPGALERGRRGDDLLAAGGPDDPEDLRVRRERLRDLDGERRVDAELRVALDDRDLLLRVRLVRIPALDVVLRPAQLLLADRRSRAGDRRGDSDRAGRAAGDLPQSRRTALPASLVAANAAATTTSARTGTATSVSLNFIPLPSCRYVAGSPAPSPSLVGP